MLVTILRGKCCGQVQPMKEPCAQVGGWEGCGRREGSQSSPEELVPRLSPEAPRKLVDDGRSEAPGRESSMSKVWRNEMPIWMGKE